MVSYCGQWFHAHFVLIGYNHKIFENSRKILDTGQLDYRHTTYLKLSGRQPVIDEPSYAVQ